MKEILQTNRLILCEWSENDSSNLSLFLQDPEVMYAYEHGFSKEEVKAWLEWTLDSYKKNGYGLWAIISKETNEVVGECGLTNQVIDQVTYCEIGYHLRKEFWHQGYAIEAAAAVKNYAFKSLGKEEVVSIVRDTNVPSMNVAIRNQMTIKKRVIKNYRGIAMPHYIFSVKRPIG
ncbi:GNAT family N-acetyltransferase [Enterococcus rivorum]|uniref:GNAT family N-acetyltransferase n=1 Tax=Enterococcus rivorum TaxID=762845 RepID=A0A1E5KUZ1_9ENTE|nr:GNAT family N-acetyltransferase [Enterococcus rivorum]MBP2100433.1 RimJ/RimL family protein N-acetyltransferase [Enterococcus rivorum]OEH81681.1 GNAT family N-acetyltransferase [Enterococcus rivorum]